MTESCLDLLHRRCSGSRTHDSTTALPSVHSCTNCGVGGVRSMVRHRCPHLLLLRVTGLALETDENWATTGARDSRSSGSRSRRSCARCMGSQRHVTPAKFAAGQGPPAGNGGRGLQAGGAGRRDRTSAGSSCTCDRPSHRRISSSTPCESIQRNAPSCARFGPCRDQYPGVSCSPQSDGHSSANTG
jgi:hypothetical protein